MSRRAKWSGIAILIVLTIVAIVVFVRSPAFQTLKLRLNPRVTVAERVAFYGPDARARLRPYFQRAGVSYPPTRFLLAGFKQEGELHLFAVGPAQSWIFIRSYPVLAVSGGLGPKLEAGDEQVPEGIYRIDALNPNSSFHLSLHLNYPNETDRLHARKDRRTDLGGDIMIHGNAVSTGCLAVGDRAAEELFVLAADSQWETARIILSPVDFRRNALPRGFRPPAWANGLYADLRRELALLPLPAQ